MYRKESNTLPHINLRLKQPNYGVRGLLRPLTLESGVYVDPTYVIYVPDV